MVIPYFFVATIKWVCSSASAMGLKTIDTSLLILLMEQPFSAINVLSQLFFSPTETRILNGHGYMFACSTKIIYWIAFLFIDGPEQPKREQKYN